MSHATITPSELARTLYSAPASTVIDVRTPGEFAEARAVPARNLPLPDVSKAGLASLGHSDTDAPVYVLCQSGRRAVAASDKLAAAGFRQPVVVTGGTEAWIAAGLPVVVGGKKAVGLERQIRIAAGAIALTGALLAQFVHPAFIWISGFVGAGLVFAGVTDICAMGLLLARAPWNRASKP
jgi:rhodanese-related sulfurtransferase